MVFEVKHARSVHPGGAEESFGRVFLFSESDMEIRIENLRLHTDFIPVLAEWQFEQWGYLTPGDSVARRITKLSGHVGNNAIPQTFVAISGNQPIGSASLAASDMTIREDLSPWLAGVYVSQSFRGHGVGSALAAHVAAQATKVGFAELYLFTPDQERLYARLGWVAMERVEYRGEDVVVMKRSCC